MLCLVDLDGILVDFMTGAHKFHQIPYSYNDYPYALGEWNCIPPDNTREFWDSLTEDFWANLDWMPDGKDILALLEFYFDKENICIATAPTFKPSCTAGKIRWIKKNIPDYERRFMVTPCKHFSASPDTVLVDDADHNVDAFAKSGGLYVLVPRKWNSNHGEESCLEYVERSLSNLFKEVER